MRLLFEIVVWGMIVCCCRSATAQRTEPSNQCGVKTDEYEQVLDAYFAHARGNSASAIVLRVYGGLAPEYEIVIDPNISPHSIFRYTPIKSIWGGAYDGLYTGKHRAMMDYVARATKVAFTKKRIEIPEAEFSDFVRRAATIDTSICEHLPLRDSAGGTHLIDDAPWLEIIEDGGRAHSKVTDTSDYKEIVSQNLSLLEWAVDVQKAARSTFR